MSHSGQNEERRIEREYSEGAPTPPRGRAPKPLAVRITRNLIMLVLLIALILVLFRDRSGDTALPPDTSAPAPSAPAQEADWHSGVLAVDEQSDRVRILLPALLFDDSWQREQYIAELGLLDARRLENGAVEIVMSRAHYAEFLPAHYSQAQQALQALWEDADFPYLIGVDYTDDLRELTLTVEEQSYAATSEPRTIMLLAALIAAYYQVYTADGVALTVQVRAHEGGALLMEGVFPQDF